MTLKSIIYIILFSTAKTGYGQDWLYAASSKDGSVYHVRTNPIATYEGRKVWSKEQAKVLSYTKGTKKYTVTNGYILTLHIYDCEGRRSKILSVAYYNAQGNVVHSNQWDEYESTWDDVVPDSIGEAVLMAACLL
jgi:hypothetical protein